MEPSEELRSLRLGYDDMKAGGSVPYRPPARGLRARLARRNRSPYYQDWELKESLGISTGPKVATYLPDGYTPSSVPLVTYNWRNYLLRGGKWRDGHPPGDVPAGAPAAGNGADRGSPRTKRRRHR